MGAVAVIGAQWGDEAKGKITHVLARRAQMTVRFNGGPNAGHTVQDSYGVAKLHQIPVGALHPGCIGAIGHGVALDLWALRREEAELAAQGRPRPRLLLSERAHLILPSHRLREARDGSADRLGTTRRGIGPCYEDRAARRGIRLGALGDRDRLRAALKAVLDEGERLGLAPGRAPDELTDGLLEVFAPFSGCMGDVRRAAAEILAADGLVVFEGAQGTLLDVDMGSYPYVTSSTTTVHGIGVGVGLSTGLVGRVVGVSKAYTTRVGEGPFPTEDTGTGGVHLRDRGVEYGATTGRPRRCGWLDLPALRHAHEVNGFTGLAVTKLDVLTGLREIPVCVDYRIGGKPAGFPESAEALGHAVPVYDRLPGWGELSPDARTLDDLPPAARRYLAFVEQGTGVPVELVGVGPGEEATIVVEDRAEGCAPCRRPA